MDVDIVYTWCDNADDKWRAKRESTAAQYGINIGGDANGSCRCRSNDDLRYSLRSLEQYAPWIHNVFIVVDDDARLPDWLNSNHPRLRIVRHSEIFLPEHLPCFCADNLEHSIVNIPGLGERFLFANDDTLFYRSVTPDFFFGQDGYPIFRYSGVYKRCDPESDNVYMLNMQRAIEVFLAKHSKVSRSARAAMHRLPHHNIDAYCKSDIMATRDEYATEILSQLRNPFRKKDNIHRIIYALEALQKGHGHLRLSSFNTSPYGGLIRRMLPAWADSLFFMNDLWFQSPKMLERFKPRLICYNDTGITTDAARIWLKDQYARLYPNPSTFERV